MDHLRCGGPLGQRGGGAVHVSRAVRDRGAVLARRSALAGQFLAGIGACLLPIAFVAVANLSAESRSLGSVGTVALAAASVATIASVGRRFGVGGGLVPAMLLPALTMVAYPHLADAGPLRFLLALVALAATGLVTMRETTRRSLGALALVLYAAVASEIFALSSNAPDAMVAAGPVWRVGGPMFGAWLGAYIAALGLSLFAVRRMQPANHAIKRVLAVAVWLGFALTAGAGALAALAALRAASPPRASVLIALGAVLAACAQARWLAARRTAAFPALLLLASATCAVACRAVPARRRRSLVVGAGRVRAARAAPRGRVAGTCVAAWRPGGAGVRGRRRAVRLVVRACAQRPVPDHDGVRRRARALDVTGRAPRPARPAGTTWAG